MIDGFVFQTQGAQRYFPHSIQKRSVVINNPVYMKFDDYRIPNERRKVIVNVGRLHKQKNQRLIINAFAKISNDFPEYTLEIYGEGELKRELETQINDLKLSDRVSLKGTTKNLMNEIVNASLFVLSSDYEGMPNALMEAMALGIPSISTDCKPGGARELINSGINGFLCNRNSEDELSECMKYILENPSKATDMGIQAKAICTTHSTNEVFNKWEKYLLSVCSAKLFS
ncbi:glycosyltransferase [Cohnella kolymensis]|uniref:glycosyltransferase n=1 Tax=Cohnella kolymensis TaxID=1590652 RepID=UPI000695B77C|nr:glycosyltransferase [Cohnella kolymensis]